MLTYNILLTCQAFNKNVLDSLIRSITKCFIFVCAGFRILKVPERWMMLVVLEDACWAHWVRWQERTLILEDLLLLYWAEASLLIAQRERERCYLILQGLFQRQFCGNKLEREQSRAFIPDILSKNIQGYSVTMTDGLFQQLTRCFWISSMPTTVWGGEGNVVNSFSLASQNQSFAYVWITLLFFFLLVSSHSLQPCVFSSALTAWDLVFLQRT